MSLSHLPTEIQDLIVLDLDPAAAIALSKTNHHFHSIVSLDRLDRDMVHIFLYDLERRQSNRFKDGCGFKKHACCKCLCLKPAMQFTYREIVRRYMSQYRWGWLDHQCLECDFRDGLVEPGVVYHCWPESSIICIECLKGQPTYCRGCRLCTCCLEKKGVSYCVNCDSCDVCLRFNTGGIRGIGRLRTLPIKKGARDAMLAKYEMERMAKCKCGRRDDLESDLGQERMQGL